MTGLLETRAMSSPRHPQDGTTSIDEDRFLLWIDGVGGFLLLTQPVVTIGGPNGADADIQLLASLSRRHATLHRDAGGYLLEAAARGAAGHGDRRRRSTRAEGDDSPRSPVEKKY